MKVCICGEAESDHVLVIAELGPGDTDCAVMLDAMCPGQVPDIDTFEEDTLKESEDDDE